MADSNPNPCDTHTNPNQAKPIDATHAMQWITGNWDHNLTQNQWEQAQPRIIKMLDECALDNWLGVGPNNSLRSFAEATQALTHKQITNTQDCHNPNLDPQDKDHICALEWAFHNSRVNDILNSRIQQIMGAAITCLIQKVQPLGKPVYSRGFKSFGTGYLTIPKAPANQILTQYMKALAPNW